MDNYTFVYNEKKRYHKLPYNYLIKICKDSDNYFAVILLFNEYFDIDIIKGIKEDKFKNIDSPYDLFNIYYRCITELEKFEFFKQSRYFCRALLEIGEYDKYINYLFFIKLYLYYLKIKIKQIVLREYIFQYNEKYSNLIFKLRINSKKESEIIYILEKK